MSLIVDVALIRHRAPPHRHSSLLLSLLIITPLIPVLLAAQGTPQSPLSAQIATRLSELATQQRPIVRAQTIASA